MAYGPTAGFGLNSLSPLGKHKGFTNQKIMKIDRHYTNMCILTDDICKKNHGLFGAVVRSASHNFSNFSHTNSLSQKKHTHFACKYKLALNHSGLCEKYIMTCINHRLLNLNNSPSAMSLFQVCLLLFNAFRKLAKIKQELLSATSSFSVSVAPAEWNY